MRKFLIIAVSISLVCFATQQIIAATHTLIVSTSSEASPPPGDFSENYQVGNWGTIEGGGQTTVGNDNHFQGTGSLFDGTVPLGPLTTHAEFNLAPATVGGQFIVSGVLEFNAAPGFMGPFDVVIGGYTDARANGVIESTVDTNGGLSDFTAGSSFSIGSAAGAAAADFAIILPTGVGSYIEALNSATNGFAGIQFAAQNGSDGMISAHGANGSGSIGATLELTTTIRPTASLAATADTTYAFNDLSNTISGASSSDPDGTIASYTFSPPGTPQAGSTLALTLAQSGITQPGGSANISLSVIDNLGAPSATDAMTMVSYTNADPNISAVGVTDNGGMNYDLLYDIDDPDFAANVVANGGVAGFESLTVDLYDDDTDTLLQTLETAVESTAAGTGLSSAVNLADGNYFLRVTDNGTTGLFADSAFAILTAVPEPATIAIWSMLGVGLGVYVVRRRRRK